MKKVLMSTAAVLALAIAAPAMAQEESGLKLDLGGHFKGYGVYVDQDENTGEEARSVDIVRDTEIHFTGETTLDNGLTVGAHIEADADQGDGFNIDESYAYFSGAWGRVNFGAEDGATFLMQVAAPSADSNYDGIRQEVSGFNYDVLAAGQTTALNGEMDYDQDVAGKSDKITYLSPVFSGFQVGVSYTPEINDTSRSLGVTDDAAADREAWEAAGRYEGHMSGVDVVVGAGYTFAPVKTETTTRKDREAYNAGIDLGMGAFGLGAVYMNDDEGTANDEVETVVVGADYTTGPFTLGVSYMNQDDTTGTDVDTDRYTGGVTYAYGPGMSFRGSVSYIDHEIDGLDDVSGTAVMLGTQINF